MFPAGGFSRFNQQKGKSMRIMRCILCAGLAMMAMAVCASMPAAAASPLETVRVIVETSNSFDHQAPAVSVVSQDVAILPSEAPKIETIAVVRSSSGNASPSFADTSIVAPAYQHIDPDIAG